LRPRRIAFISGGVVLANVYKDDLKYSGGESVRTFNRD